MIYNNNIMSPRPLFCAAVNSTTRIQIEMAGVKVRSLELSSPESVLSFLVRRVTSDDDILVF